MTAVRWIRFQGNLDEAECERVRRTELYKIGDTIPVWVNEGDILLQQNLDPPGRKLCGPCRRSNVKVCWDLDCDYRDPEPPAE